MSEAVNEIITIQLVTTIKETDEGEIMVTDWIIDEKSIDIMVKTLDNSNNNIMVDELHKAIEKLGEWVNNKYPKVIK